MRTRAVILILALCSALLGGCAQSGDEKEKAERKAGPPLTAKQLHSALLVKGNLGKRFALDRSPDDSDGPKLGCLDKLDKLGRKMPDALRERDVSFKATTPVGLPVVSSFVATYASEAKADRALDIFDRATKDCRKVSVVDDGVRLRLTVGTTTLTLAKEAEQQVNLNATGTFSGAGGGLPIVLELTVVRLGRHIVGVLMSDLARSLQGARRELTDVAMERLIAIVDGKKLPKPEPVLDDYPLVTPKDLRPSF